MSCPQGGDEALSLDAREGLHTFASHALATGLLPPLPLHDQLYLENSLSSLINSHQYFKDDIYK